ncbi:hypothetical protein [Deinococcus aestuarii]|uniref:hypothetical protein n=1 Tax=Deinococcus aestuarii TaxID=2774531 RepID=UPI001C0B736B|nr:hypothetical protein [Deinococcus aestuarii]
MALSLNLNRAGTRLPLNVPVVVNGQGATLTGCWSDGYVEVHQGHQSRIVNVVDLAREEPALIQALSVLVQHVCSDQLANAKIRLMSTAAVKASRITRSNNASHRPHQASHDQRAPGWKTNRTQGMVLLWSQVGDLTLEGVTPDGREWLICGHHVPFTLIVERCPDLLPELLLAARPALRNFAGFVQAVRAESPSLRTHPRFREPPTATNVVLKHASTGFEWVADALAAHRRSPPAELPFLRPLHNRARHVR